MEWTYFYAEFHRKSPKFLLSSFVDRSGHYEPNMQSIWWYKFLHKLCRGCNSLATSWIFPGIKLKQWSLPHRMLKNYAWFSRCRGGSGVSSRVQGLRSGRWCKVREWEVGVRIISKTFWNFHAERIERKSICGLKKCPRQFRSHLISSLNLRPKVGKRGLPMGMDN